MSDNPTVPKKSWFREISFMAQEKNIFSLQYNKTINYHKSVTFLRMSPIYSQFNKFIWIKTIPKIIFPGCSAWKHFHVVEINMNNHNFRFDLFLIPCLEVFIAVIVTVVRLSHNA